MTSAAQKDAATKARNFRTFSFMQPFDAAAIGARIAQARKEKGMTQEELAGMAGFSVRSLQDYEGGKTLPFRHIREFSKLLNRPEEWFLYGEEQLDASRLAELAEQLDQISAGVTEILRRLDDAA